MELTVPSTKTFSGLAAFDMDGTLLNGRLVYSLANRFDLSNKVQKIQSSFGPGEGHLQTTAIATLFAGIHSNEIVSAVQSIPLSTNCKRTITTLNGLGYATGIISDSYTLAAEFLAQRLGMDFVGANKLEVKDEMITGKVIMPLGWERIGCFCKISVCKRYHLELFAEERGVELGNTVAVGDTRSDICMVQRAGTGIAFMPKDSEIAKAACNVINDGDLYKVLSFIT